jgi:hypothetical protein
MKMDARMRWPAWIAILAVAAGVSLSVTEPEGESLVQAVERPRPHAATPPERALRGEPAERVRFERLSERPRVGGEVADVFAARSWRKPEPAAAPERPSAPPLPFTYLGRLHTTDSDTAFVALGERNLVVRSGDVIQDTYRVERVAGSAVTFRHLPTGAQQTLAIGGSP